MDPFMTVAEELLSSFFSEAPSRWLDDFSNQDGGKILKAQVSEETLATDLFRVLEQDSLLGDTDPLPGWMSEKVSLTSWLDDVPLKPLLTDSSLPSTTVKQDLAAPTTTPILPEELFNTLVLDTSIAPQPPSPGEAPAPDLLALSPSNSILSADDSSYPSSPSSTGIASPESPVEHQWEIIESAAPFQVGLNLTTLDLTQVIQSAFPECGNASVSLTVVDETTVSDTPARSKQKSKAKSKLKSVSDPVIRKSKKRDQNKKAATRYRQKKRTEQEILDDEKECLETTNKGLSDKVESISREIKYLKDLLVEVYKVKGEIKVMTRN